MYILYTDNLLVIYVRNVCSLLFAFFLETLNASKFLILIEQNLSKIFYGLHFLMAYLKYHFRSSLHGSVVN